MTYRAPKSEKNYGAFVVVCTSMRAVLIGVSVVVSQQVALSLMTTFKLLRRNSLRVSYWPRRRWTICWKTTWVLPDVYTLPVELAVSLMQCNYAECLESVFVTFLVLRFLFLQCVSCITMCSCTVFQYCDDVVKWWWWWWWNCLFTQFSASEEI